MLNIGIISVIIFLKKAKLVSEAMEDNKYEVRTYEDAGIKIRVLRYKIDPKLSDRSLARKQIYSF